VPKGAFADCRRTRVKLVVEEGSNAYVIKWESRNPTKRAEFPIVQQSGFFPGTSRGLFRSKLMASRGIPDDKRRYSFSFENPGESLDLCAASVEDFDLWSSYFGELLA
jgi:hypothetical protein